MFFCVLFLVLWVVCLIQINDDNDDDGDDDDDDERFVSLTGFHACFLCLGYRCSLVGVFKMSWRNFFGIVTADVKSNRHHMVYDCSEHYTKNELDFLSWTKAKVFDVYTFWRPESTNSLRKIKCVKAKRFF